MRSRNIHTLAAAGVLLAAPLAVASAHPATLVARDGGIVPGMRTAEIVAPRGFFTAVSKATAAAHVPAFSRQTKLACSACHYNGQFPQLTPFGRMFKLNGYTLTGLSTIGEPIDSSMLKLAPIPPVAGMLVTSLTNTSAAQPGTQNGTVSLPQEASIFFAGQVTQNVGVFSQFTYAAPDAGIGIDNLDVRYARHATLGDKDVLFGVTLHNNPTVQDVWNTTPAWGYPFMGSEVAPAPTAGTMIDGGLEQQVLGLGVYSLFNNLLYAEATVYRSAPQGAAMPLDASAENTTNGVAPYWRLALQHQSGSNYMMLGTYGLAANLYPQGVTGPTNRYTDIGADAQIEHGMGSAVLIGRAAYTHEQQRLDAAYAGGDAANLKPSLSTVKASVSYLPSDRYGFNVAYFQSSGTTDTLLFAPNPVDGSRTGSPNSAGEMGEFTYSPWENTRLGLQYVIYNKFNGSSSAYDMTGGRSASDNNTLYLYTWLAF